MEHWASGMDARQSAEQPHSQTHEQLNPKPKNDPLWDDKYNKRTKNIKITKGELDQLDNQAPYWTTSKEKSLTTDQ